MWADVVAELKHVRPDVNWTEPMVQGRVLGVRKRLRAVGVEGLRAGRARRGHRGRGRGLAPHGGSAADDTQFQPTGTIGAYRVRQTSGSSEYGVSGQAGYDDQCARAQKLATAAVGKLPAPS